VISKLLNIKIKRKNKPVALKLMIERPAKNYQPEIIL
jgi:hypothetical protein